MSCSSRCHSDHQRGRRTETNWRQRPDPTHRAGRLRGTRSASSPCPTGNRISPHRRRGHPRATSAHPGSEGRTTLAEAPGGPSRMGKPHRQCRRGTQPAAPRRWPWRLRSTSAGCAPQLSPPRTCSRPCGPTRRWQRRHPSAMRAPSKRLPAGGPRPKSAARRPVGARPQAPQPPPLIAAFPRSAAVPARCVPPRAQAVFAPPPWRRSAQHGLLALRAPPEQRGEELRSPH
mmetsp:Transcript_2481/g.7072  ORF Transcript_2481/g.7072 Transcript_2481/m.7072 type:complete len:231 (-) Transcript_2481:431-1123(-)